MAKAVALHDGRRQSAALPRLDEAKALFDQHGRSDSKELRRVYLRLALQFHPDKHLEQDRQAATQLFQAIAAAYEGYLQEMDSAGAQTVQRVKSRVAAAAELGEIQELRRLLAESPDAANEADDLGVAPLMFAAAGGYTAAAEVLLDYGADINFHNPINWSVMLYAALHDHSEMVKFLAGRGLKVEDHDLILAAYTGNPNSLEAMLELYEGSVAELRTDESTKTLLHLACEGMCFLRHSPERHARCVDLTLRWGAPIDAREPRRRRTALHGYVSDKGWHTRGFESSATHMDLLETLCRSGADVTAEDSEGNSALSMAASAGLCQVREVLLSYA